MMLSTETAYSALREAGVRLTPQRLFIVQALAGNRQHPTIDQIYALVRQQYPTISLATVYQTVTLLARQGLILEVHGSKDGLRCDPDTTPHAHAFCQQCGKVFDIDLTPALAHPAITLPAGFTPMQTEISIYGCCAECAPIEN